MRNICEKETARNPMNRRCTSARIGEKEKQEQGKKNHHPILQLTYTNSSPATERMPKTPRGRRRRSIPTQVREKRISRPLPGPTKSNSQGPAKERKLGSGALSRTFQQVLVSSFSADFSWKTQMLSRWSRLPENCNTETNSKTLIF
jgi:hypothetical protein